MKYLISCLLLAAGFHPFHLSVTDIYHNREEKTLEISMKLFIDDLDFGIEESGAGKMYLGTKKENAESDLFIYKYLLENMEINLDGKQADFEFVGKEYEPGNVVYCYFMVKGVKKFSRIKLKNHVLTEVFSDQQNIIHVKKDGKTKSLRLRRGLDEAVLSF